MYQNLLKRFRQDLVIRKTWKAKTESQLYLIEDPTTKTTFEFGEEEFFLCQSLDGQLTIEEILARFKVRFASSIKLEDFARFYQQIDRFELLEFVNERANYNGKINSLAATDEEDEDYDYEDDLFGEFEEGKDWGFVIKTEQLFKFTASIVKLTGISIQQFVFGMLPLVAIASYLWFKYWLVIIEDREFIKSTIHFIGSFVVFFIAENLCGKFMKGVVAATDGATVTDFAIHLRWYFIPRFHIRIAKLRKLSRTQQMWIQGTPLVNRMIIFVVGTFTWYFNLGSGTTLSGWGVVFAGLGLLTFLHDAFPLRYRSAGNKILCLYFYKPASYTRQLIKRSFKFVKSFWSKSDSQNEAILSQQEIWLMLFCIVILCIESYIATEVVQRFAEGLSKTFPEIFGKGTYNVFLIILGILAFKYMTKRLFGGPKIPLEVSDLNALESNLARNSSFVDLFIYWFEKIFKSKYILLFALALLLCLPIDYTPGGEIQLLAPKQEEIQAPVSGKIERVFFNGGDGKLIKAGTIVAKMVAADLQNQILTIQEQIKQQQANLQEQEIDRDKLIAGPRKEELEVAKVQIDVAQQKIIESLDRVKVVRAEVEESKDRVAMSQKQVEIAKNQLESALISARYSTSELSRLEKFAKNDIFSLERLEEVRKKVETDQIYVKQGQQYLAVQTKNLQQMQHNFEAQQKNLAEVRQDVAIAQKNWQEAKAQYKLVSIGSPSQDIEASRQEVEAATAGLKNLEQQLKYYQEQNKSTDLIMPFDGYLIDDYLQEKVGTYLYRGESFATVEDSRNLFAELKLPEYDESELKVGEKAHLKLLVYPNDPIPGKVVSIEPAANTPDSGEGSDRFLRVKIEPQNSHEILKAGMSGYGKIEIGKEPAITILTRPFVRFIQVQLWSWLP